MSKKTRTALILAAALIAGPSLVACNMTGSDTCQAMTAGGRGGGGRSGGGTKSKSGTSKTKSKSGTSKTKTGGGVPVVGDSEDCDD